MKVNSAIYFLFFLLFSCQTIDYKMPIYYSDYFPVEFNNTKEYFVTSISHTSFGTDSSSYYLKETIAEFFIDDQGDSAYKLERFWKTDSLEDFVIKDIWIIKKTISSAELVEENERFIKMIFPLSKYSYWDGNSYNGRGTQEYTIENLHSSYLINGFNFDSSVTVIQNYISNQIEYESEKEVYAKGLGLIYKENLILNINDGDILDINYGSEYKKKLISY